MEIAAESWAKHKLRENSILQDIFGCQMRSKLTCLECGNVSVCFEYQNTVPIAIPRNYTRTITVCFLPQFDELGTVLLPPLQQMMTLEDSQSNRLLHKLGRLRQHALRPLLMSIVVDTLSPVQKIKDEVMTMLSRRVVIDTATAHNISTTKDILVSNNSMEPTSAIETTNSMDSGNEGGNEGGNGGEEDDGVCGSMYKIGDIQLYLAKGQPRTQSKAAAAVTNNNQSNVVDAFVNAIVDLKLPADELVGRLPPNINLFAISTSNYFSHVNCMIYQVLYCTVHEHRT